MPHYARLPDDDEALVMKNWYLINKYPQTVDKKSCRSLSTRGLNRPWLSLNRSRTLVSHLISRTPPSHPLSRTITSHRGGNALTKPGGGGLRIRRKSFLCRGMSSDIPPREALAGARVCRCGYFPSTCGRYSVPLYVLSFLFLWPAGCPVVAENKCLPGWMTWYVWKGRIVAVLPFSSGTY